MANINFFRTKAEEDKFNNIVKLKHYVETESSSEYYTYIDSKNNEVKYTGIIANTSNGYVGKISVFNKVNLSYVIGVESVEGIPEHFTYIDNIGNEVKYDGNVVYDNESNTYIGEVKYVELTDEIKPIYLIEE